MKWFYHLSDQGHAASTGMSSLVIRTGGAFMVILLVLALVGCGTQPAEDSKESDSTGPMPVFLYAASTGDAEASFSKGKVKLAEASFRKSLKMTDFRSDDDLLDHRHTLTVKNQTSDGDGLVACEIYVGTKLVDAQYSRSGSVSCSYDSWRQEFPGRTLNLPKLDQFGNDLHRLIG